MLMEVDPAPDDWVEYPNEGFLTVRRKDVVSARVIPEVQYES